MFFIWVRFSFAFFPYSERKLGKSKRRARQVGMNPEEEWYQASTMAMFVAMSIGVYVYIWAATKSMVPEDTEAI